MYCFAALSTGKSLTNGGVNDEVLDEVAMMRQEKVAKFAHHKRVADYLLGKSVGEGSFAKVRLGLHVQTAEEVSLPTWFHVFLQVTLFE